MNGDVLQVAAILASQEYPANDLSDLGFKTRILWHHQVGTRPSEMRTEIREYLYIIVLTVYLRARKLARTRG